MVTLVVHPRKKRDPAADHDLGFKVKVSGKLKLQQKFLQEPEPYCSCLLTRHQVCIIRMLQPDRQTDPPWEAGPRAAQYGKSTG